MIDNNCTYRLVLISCDFERFLAILGTSPLPLLKRSKGRRQRPRFPAGSRYFRSIFSLKTINLRFLTSLDEGRIVVESFDVNSCEKTDQCHPEISRYVHKIRHKTYDPLISWTPWKPLLHRKPKQKLDLKRDWTKFLPFVDFFPMCTPPRSNI